MGADTTVFMVGGDFPFKHGTAFSVFCFLLAKKKKIACLKTLFSLPVFFKCCLTFLQFLSSIFFFFSFSLGFSQIRCKRPHGNPKIRHRKSFCSPCLLSNVDKNPPSPRMEGGAGAHVRLALPCCRREVRTSGLCPLSPGHIPQFPAASVTAATHCKLATIQLARGGQGLSDRKPSAEGRLTALRRLGGGLGWSPQTSGPAKLLCVTGGRTQRGFCSPLCILVTQA